MKRTALILALAVAAVANTAIAQTAPLNVEIDRSARIALRGAAASVIVGNPAIADVTVVDANTLYIVGKGYGVTEVVAVDAIGRPLFQNQIVVTGGSTGAVRMWRGGQMTEMACGGSCAPSIRSTGPGAAAAPAVSPP
ncbi:MAG: pilus assembly protein N-terminal domain-containing protein [Caulobacterales bacterium]|nr:pilus assembly protein N-terminal domain-containing protein [Caulobacterales bacterium]